MGATYMSNDDLKGLGAMSSGSNSTDFYNKALIAIITLMGVTEHLMARSDTDLKMAKLLSPNFNVFHIYTERSELYKDIFETPNDPTCVQDNKVTEEQQDVGVSNLMDVDQPYLANNVFDDVHVEDADQTKQQLTTPVKCKKRRHKSKKKSKKMIRTVFRPDGNEIPLLTWKECSLLLSAQAAIVEL
ncbi:hypothetical protein Tco_0748251 [Tanacetum coccineum]|uniref:Uncharacterized protein n=1 Tax=Tanacetum coccineum TaxID=301880 RepID=A0ABQ4YW02_9ASTR